MCYSYPFPTALHDGYLATKWVVTNARTVSADVKRIAEAGHDVDGNLATGLAAMVRDQVGFRFSAPALLDPSMTHIANLDSEANPDMRAAECALGYQAYLPVASHQIHPYGAPIESHRLNVFPAAFIASAKHDLMHVEAKRYAAELIAAAVPTTVARYVNVAHNGLASRREVLADVVAFFS